MEGNDISIVLGVSEASGNCKISFRRPSSKGTKRLPHKVSSSAGKKHYLTKSEREREAKGGTKMRYLKALLDFYGRFQAVTHSKNSKYLKKGLSGVRWREFSLEEEKAFREKWKGKLLTSSKSKVSSSYQTHNNNHAKVVRAIFPCFGPGYFVGADHNFYSPLGVSDALSKLKALVDHTKRGFYAIDTKMTSKITERIKSLQANYPKDCLQIYNDTHDSDINALVDYIYFADESVLMERAKRAQRDRKAKIGDCHDVGLPSTTAPPSKTSVSSLTLSPKDAELPSNYSSHGTYHSNTGFLSQTDQSLTSENQTGGRTDHEHLKCGHSQDHKFKLAGAENVYIDANTNNYNYGDGIPEYTLNNGIPEHTLNDGNFFYGHFSDDLTDLANLVDYH